MCLRKHNLFTVGQISVAVEWVISKPYVERHKEEMFRCLGIMLRLDRVGPQIWPIHDKFNFQNSWKNKRKVTRELFNISFTFMKIKSFPDC